MDLFSWLAVFVGITGTLLVIRRRPVGFYLWCVSNIALLAINVRAGSYPQATLFAVYLIMSIYGAWEWQQEHGR